MSVSTIGFLSPHSRISRRTSDRAIPIKIRSMHLSTRQPATRQDTETSYRFFSTTPCFGLLEGNAALFCCNKRGINSVSGITMVERVGKNGGRTRGFGSKEHEKGGVKRTAKWLRCRSQTDGTRPRNVPDSHASCSVLRPAQSSSPPNEVHEISFCSSAGYLYSHVCSG